MSVSPSIVSENERRVLRDLARQVADIASLPIQSERIDLWKRLNALQPVRPMVLAHPQEGWRELVPDSEIVCRQFEWLERELRMKIFRHKYIPDDYPITDEVIVGTVVRTSDFGLSEAQFRSEERGSYRWDPPIKDPSDVGKLRHRTIEVDHEATRKQLEIVNDLVGDILHVRCGVDSDFRCRLTRILIHLRGLDQMMLDLYDNPGLLHELMAFLRDDLLAEWQLYERENVLLQNNRPESMLSAGGMACTDELPAGDFEGRVRLKDLWCWGESQETVGVGPDQFYEFVLQYQIPLMEHFGLVNYGCCEPLDTRFDLLIEYVPNLRAVAVSPWCNREKAAEKLGNRFVYVYKPNPSFICAPTPDFAAAEKEIRDTLRIARGCCLSITMKDTHTFHNQKDRIGRWAEMASAVVQESI